MLKLVVALVVAGFLQCTYVYGQIQTCKYPYVITDTTNGSHPKLYTSVRPKELARHNLVL